MKTRRPIPTATKPQERNEARALARELLSARKGVLGEHVVHLAMLVLDVVEPDYGPKHDPSGACGAGCPCRDPKFRERN